MPSERLLPDRQSCATELEISSPGTLHTKELDDEARGEAARIARVCGFKALADEIEQPYRDGWRTLVGLTDGQVVAVVFGLTHSEYGESDWRSRANHGPQAWIHELAVDPGHRRRGYGTQMLLAFARAARGDGSTFLALATSPSGQDPTGAQRFYKALGMPRLNDEPATFGEPILDLLTRHG